MTRRQQLIQRIAKRKRSHSAYRHLEIKLVRMTTAKLRREIRSGK